MSRTRRAILLVVCLTAFVTASGANRADPAFASRHSSGPVTYRGTVSKVSKSRFEFVSPTKGTFEVFVRNLTEFFESGKRIHKLSLAVGTHIGVRGYLKDRTFQAIRVTIYPSSHPAAPKEYTFRGYFVNGSTGKLSAKSHHLRFNFVLDKGAKVTYRLKAARLKQGVRGERVDVRYFHSGRRLVATSVLLLVIHFKEHPFKGHFVGVRKGVLLARSHGHITRFRLARGARISYRNHAAQIERASRGQLMDIRYHQTGDHLIADSVLLLVIRLHEYTFRGHVISASANKLVARASGSAHVFHLAKGAKVTYRNAPAGLGRAKPGERVDVRYYRSSSRLLATSVLLLVVVKSHPPIRTVYGLVVSSRRHSFRLLSTSGRHLSVRFPHAPPTLSEVSVHGFNKDTWFMATQVYRLSRLPLPSHLVRGTITTISKNGLTIRSGQSEMAFDRLPTSTISSGASAARWSGLTRRHFVSVRFCRIGARLLIGSVHEYAQQPIPPSTGQFRGRVNAVSRHGIALTVKGKPVSFQITAQTSIRMGTTTISLSKVRIGSLVKIRYYGKTSLTALSVYVYVTATNSKTTSGPIVRVGVRVIEVLTHSGIVKVDFDQSSIHGSGGSNLAAEDLAIGQKVVITGSVSKHQINAATIDLVSQKASGSGADPITFRGTVVSTGRRRLTLNLAGFGDLTFSVSAKTVTRVSQTVVPFPWVSAGSSGAVAVRPRPGKDPMIRELIYRPTMHSLSGTITHVGPSSVTVMSRAGSSERVLMKRAKVTDDRSSNASDVLAQGLYVQIEGFALRGGKLAALSLAVSHPTVRVSGTIDTVGNRKVLITRSNGETVVLRFPRGQKIAAAPTGEQFLPSQLPVGIHLSATGTQEAGWVRVTSAIATLRSSLFHATVSKIKNPNVLRVQPDTGGAVETVRLTSKTTLVIGRQPTEFSSIEIGDDLSVRGYPSSRGGYIASSVDLLRPYRTRTGTVSNLQAQEFDVLARDGGTTHITIGSETSIMEGTKQLSASDLKEGMKVQVTGHMAPDGVIEATRVNVE